MNKYPSRSEYHREKRRREEECEEHAYEQEEWQFSQRDGPRRIESERYEEIPRYMDRGQGRKKTDWKYTDDELETRGHPDGGGAEIVKTEERKRRWVGDIVYYAILAVVVVGVLVLQGQGNQGPRYFAGFSAFTVLTSSMESEIPKGSLVICRQVDPNTLKVGDDITYMANQTTTVTHRIIGITENYQGSGERAFETQGIMNDVPDKQPVTAANVVGKVVFHSLILGKIFSFISEYWLPLLILSVLTISLIVVLRNIFGKRDA